MSKCRATSFYLAPGTSAYFDTCTLATKAPSGEFISFTHRRDLERYEKENPDWDHVCFLGPAGGVSVLEEVLRRSPEKVERYRLDARVINGRSPSGPAQTIYRLHASGVQKAGGIPQITNALFPDATKPLRDAVASALSSRSPGFILGLAHTLRANLGDDRTAALIENCAILSRTLTFSPIDPSELGPIYDTLISRYGQSRATTVLSQLGSLASLPQEWRRALAITATDPEFLRTLRAVSGTEYDNSLSINPACPAGILGLLSLTNALTRRDVAAHPNTPLATLERLIVPETTDHETAIALADRDLGSLSPTILNFLSQDRSQVLRRHLAKNKTLPHELAVSWAQSSDAPIRDAIATYHSGSLDIATLLCSDPEQSVRMYLARATPFSDILNTLSHDEYYSVREAVAKNPATPPSTLRALYESDADSINISFGLCANPSTPPATLKKLSEEVNYAPRVAENPSASTDLLRSLANHPTLTRSLGAYPDPGYQEYAGLAHDLLRALALNANTPPDVLRTLAAVSGPVKVFVAKNKSIDTELALELFNEAKATLVPATEFLEKGDPRWGKFSSSSWEILDQLASNPASTPEMVTELVENAMSWGVIRVFSRSDIPHTLLDSLLTSEDHHVLRAIAASPSASAQLLRSLSLSTDYLIRRDVIANPLTPPDALINALTLSSDPDHHVRAALVSSPPGITSLRPTHPALQHLKEVALVSAIDQSSAVWPERPRSVFDLPGRSSLPWNIDEAARSLDGATITTSEGELSLEILDSHQRLKTNATYMGNCTAGYASQVAAGHSVIVAIKDQQRVLYNAEFRPSVGGTWELGEVNSRRNAGLADPSLRGVLEELAASILAKP